MAIKAGELIHAGGQVLFDRLQTAGPGNLSVPQETIYELGNYKSVAIVRDIPDLSFSLESLDVSAEVEALLTGGNFSTDPAGTEYKLAESLPIDIVSQFKAGRTAAAPFDVIASAAAPFLAVESVSYRFGLRDNASQSVQLRGDSLFFNDASAFIQETAGTNMPNQVINFANAPLLYSGDTVAGPRYALSVTLVKGGRRLTPGVDYTETVTAVTILDAVPTTESVRIVYQSATVASYPQASHALASAVRPAAVKGRDIEIKVGGSAITDRWSSVQSVNVDYRVQLERDEELGNQQIVNQDYDVPEVSGTVELKPRDAAELIERVRQIAGVSGTEVVGPLQSVLLPIEIVIHSPDDGQTLKTLYVPDARFTLPGFSGQVRQKLNVSFAFQSDSGDLSVYKGAKP